MNYNALLSQKDVIEHKNLLAKFNNCLSKLDEHRIVDVSACMRIFERTFAAECPKCNNGYLVNNHITYYNKDIMRCSNCGHSISLDSLQS